MTKHRSAFLTSKQNMDYDPSKHGYCEHSELPRIVELAMKRSIIFEDVRDFGTHPDLEQYRYANYRGGWTGSFICENCAVNKSKECNGMQLSPTGQIFAQLEPAVSNGVR